MHKEILSENQLDLIPLVKKFRREYYLVGGAAIALHIGHRRSIDFDLFKFSTLRPKNILSEISAFNYPYTITRRVTEQMNVTIQDVKFTFFQYPFKVEAKCRFEDYLRLPELIDLAAMKAYALGRRSAQLTYFEDIDHSESIEYLIPPVPDDEIKEFLVDKATDIDLF